MADFPDSTLLPKLHQSLSRRLLLRGTATACVMLATPAVAVADPDVKISEVILEIEKYAIQIIVFNNQVWIHYGDGRTGEFAQAEGRVALIDGTVVPATTAGTFDASYELIIERMDK